MAKAWINELSLRSLRKFLRRILDRIMKFNTLYARTNTGAVQEWTVFVGENFYTTTYGQKDGKLVSTDPSYCLGKNLGKKNETSPQDQAVKEAKALYKKKLKEGYFEDVTHIDKETFFQPQLAKPFNKYIDKVVYPLAAEDKLNGIRCAITKKGAFSRTGEEFYCIDHIKNELAYHFEENPNLVLDGELFNPLYKNELNKIASLVSVNRKAADVTDEDKQRAKDIVQFHTYDAINFTAQDIVITNNTAFVTRKEALKSITKDLSYTRFHPYQIVKNYEEIDALMKKVKEENREGLVIKVLDAPYQNKRSSNMLKLKLFIDEEFEVVEFLEGTGNWGGKVKKVVCKLNVPATNGKITFESNIRGTMEQLAELWINRMQHIGKFVTVDFQEWSPYGIPLIPYCDPMFRDYE